MELAAMYERALARDVGISLYAAPSGEPALGPVAFMHRPSAMDNPAAPLGHHWQDATHVSFGVLTAGLFTHRWKLEASAFNGHEPDENRWDFDPIKLGSYAARFTVNPDERWSLSAAYGYLDDPEILHPTESMHRMTASVMHGAALGAAGQVATTFVWGANKHSTASSFAHSVLAESEAILNRANTVFGRAEIVQKSAEDLALDEPPFNLASARRFNVGAATFGYIRELLALRAAPVGLGAAGTVNLVPSSLRAAYGSTSPLGAIVFIRLRPIGAGRAMSGMPNMHDTVR
jgi:hypothetical protein